MRSDDGLHDAGHGQARLIAQPIGIDGHLAPRGDLQAVMVQRALGELHPADDVMRIEEEDAHGQRVGIDRVSGNLLGFAREETGGEGDQDAGPIAGPGVGVERAAMLQVDQRVDAQVQNLAAGAAMPIGHKADSAIAAIILRLIRRRSRRHGQPPESMD